MALTLTFVLEYQQINELARLQIHKSGYSPSLESFAYI